MATDPVTLEFGNRIGSWVALALFGTVFGMLGFAIHREIRRRSRSTAPWIARGAGLLFFLGPLSLLYAGSIAGFYEARIDGQALRLHYFLGATTDIPLSEISEAKAVPWYRGRWRLEIVRSSGKTYESATSHQLPVSVAAARLTERTAAPNGTRP